MADPGWLQDGLDHLWLPYTQMKTMARPLAVASTQGARIRLVDGRELIDGVASWWTAVHGYNHPRILAAVSDQLSRMPHIMLGGLVHEPASQLAARLTRLAPGDFARVFFTESGSVAVEVAMKVAVQYWRNAFGQTRTKFVSFRGGYHGDTFATMAVCDPEEGMHALFKGALAEQIILPLPREEASAAGLERALGERRDIAGVIVEPLLQGAGGMLVHDEATLRRLRALCDAHGALLIFDEIFTGFGRTGAMFAATRAGVSPDIMTLGKALTGGVCPLAATLVSARIYEAFHGDDPEKALMHGPTFTGHALACAAANASLDLFEEEPRLDQIAAIERRMRAAFEALRRRRGVKDVRILGAVGAVELEQGFDREQTRAAFIDEGVFIRPLGRTIYLSPAYTIGEEELDALTGAVVRRVEALTA
ncbi:MAG: adenosylmethionine--8-amino-7-oxononanoate transaminase [Alphaproteobacteria bacterium]|nr:adenosylmethionine--8-amino-7-oxononanoate transaminase [Alphaproteobacteria bacterium]